MKNLEDRADTYTKKRAVLERLLVAWEQSPTERLTQFINNSAPGDNFYCEDFELVRLAEARVAKQGKIT